MGVLGAKPLKAPETLHFAIPENKQKCMLVANVLLYTANIVTGKLFYLFRFIKRKIDSIGESPIKTREFHHFFEKSGFWFLKK